MSLPYRIAHISDIHLWRFTWNPFLWMGKRALGLGNLALRRGRKFRREALAQLVAAIEGDGVDHLVVSGDLTTTSLPQEFALCKDGLSRALNSPTRATVLPGNHDRYTRATYRRRLFDLYFGDFCDGGRFPFLKPLTEGLDLIGFDPNIPRPFSARGLVKNDDVEKLKGLLKEIPNRGTETLLFVCHYPAEVPSPHHEQGRAHELVGGESLVAALSGIEIPIYWLHGHIHNPWRHQSPTVPNLIYLNPGAPLYRTEAGVSLGRWILDWEGGKLRTEWRSTPETSESLVDTVIC